MNHTHTSTLPSSLFFVLFAMLAVLGCVYLYLIQSSVVSVMERRSYETRASQLESQLATLESSYVHLIGSITLTDATARGFVDVSKATDYALTKTPASGVAMRHGN